MLIDSSIQFTTEQASGLVRAIRLVYRSTPGWTFLSAALRAAQGILPLLSLYLMKLVVDAVARGLATPNPGAAFGQIAFIVILAGVIVLVGEVCRTIAGLVSEAQSLTVTDYVHDILHAKSIEADLEYYESPQYYDTLHRAQQEAPFRPTRIVYGLLQVGQSSISLVAMAGLVLSFHWGVAVIIMAAVTPGILVRLKHAGRIYRWHRQRTPTDRQARYYDWMLTTDGHAKEIRLFNLGLPFIRRFRDLRQQLRQERLQIATKRSAMELLTQASGTLAVYGSYAFIAYRTVQGVITLGDLVMYYQAFQRGQGFLREMLAGLAGLYEDSLFLANLYEFLDLKRTVIEPSHPQPVPRPMTTGIVFDHVNFQYPMSAKMVLQDIRLAMRPGEVVALVGENGSGKTTLVKLLCRLYDPTSGAITLDGVDLRQFTIASLRRQISVIFQDYSHYHLTAQDNIWFGNVDVPPERERIAAAAWHTGADDIITRLPQGYETILGKWFENGVELSIGEWQKVALARAFLRDAQIIVLDEPTSAMDANAEYEVFQRFRQLAKGRTAILISHRLSTIRMADCIYVLERGKIVERGVHNELMRRGGIYAGLFETQAQNYR
jgi:ATP-binding cassette, subfamily B, bacterial